MSSLVTLRDRPLAGKRRRMSRWLGRLRRTYERPPEPEERRPLDWLLREHLTDELGSRRAAQALRLLAQEFVDWNEVRVSRDSELVKTMAGLGLTAEQAAGLRSILAALFKRTNTLSLDHLRGKPHHDINALMNALGVSRRAAAATALLTLEANVLTMKAASLRVLRRLEAVHGSTADEALEELALVVAADDRADFYWLFAKHARLRCRERAPDCPQCVLLADCPTGRARTADGKKARKTGAPKKKRTKR